MIRTNNQKPTIVCMTDLADTGFGRVGKEIVSRIARTSKYNVVYLGWVAQNDPELHHKWRELGVKIETTQLTIDDQFGQKTLPKVIKQFNPEIIWTLGDPWMVEHVGNQPERNTYKWVSYVPIDRDVLPELWLPSLKNPDVLVLYSKFGQEVH